VLAITFGVTVAMWVIAYLGLMQPGLLLGELFFVWMMFALFEGGFIAGRRSAAGWRDGLLVGLFSAMLNLLIMGSTLVDPQTHRLHEHALVWVGGMFAGSMALASFGGAVGRRFAPPTLPPRDWFNVFVCVTGVAVFLLLLSGGLVTGLKAGLAVPDWPRSFGYNMFLYPVVNMTGGVFYEHAHRLYGSLVGITSIVLMVSMFRFDRRVSLRVLGAAIFFMVCLQGIMGGLRVTETNTALAIVHGVFGQMVLAAVVAAAALTAPAWLAPTPNLARAPTSPDRAASTVLVVLLILQVAVGALYRHLRREADASDAATHYLYAHIAMAAIVTAVAVFAGGRAWAFHPEAKPLRRTGMWLLVVVGGQLLLGIVAMMLVLSGRDSEASALEVAFTTAHQATGALLLALATALALWTRRFSVRLRMAPRE
jgi:cytochrome c oxidase assembly protein subunit 15